MKLHPFIVMFATASVVCAAPNGKGGGHSGSAGIGIGAGANPGLGNPASSLPPAPRVDLPAPPRAERADEVARGPRVDATARGRAAAGVDVPAARSAAPAARDLSSAMHDINQAAFAQRRQLHESVDMRLQSSRESLKQIQANAKNLRADARADFKAAVDDVKAREKELNSALRSARNAKEADWEASRGSLARAYQAHADAMVRLEAIPLPKR